MRILRWIGFPIRLGVVLVTATFMVIPSILWLVWALIFKPVLLEPILFLRDDFADIWEWILQ